ncbi:MAG: hypothetical protein ACLQFR_02025, partial [Streptosporangiaceae bacterium]
MKDDIAGMLAAEAEAAEQLRDEDDLGETYVPRHPPRDPSQVYSVRIPVGRLEQLRQRAAAEGVAPSALMRRWVIERLDTDEFEKVPKDFEALAAAFVAALTSVQPRALGDAIWMVARAENEQALLVFQDE